MKKRIISLLMAAVILLGMAVVPASAASSLEEAMQDVNVYARNDDLNWLMMNGSVATQHYTYYLYRSEITSETKEIPAYCTDPRLYGVPALVPQGTAIRYGAEGTVSDPKIMGIVANGYPHIDLGTLGLQTIEEAYYATKTALWCYLLGTWSIDGLSVNPSADQAAAQRVLAAARDIYNRGIQWDKLVEPKLTAVPDRDVAYAATVNGQSVYQQIFTVTSETWSYYPVTITLADGAPSGTKLLDMNNNPVSSLNSSDATHGSDGYSWQIKVVYPAASVEGQEGTVQLNLSSVVVQYELYHAKCLETDTYGNAQRYVLDTDPHIPISANAVSTYSSDPPPPDDPTPGGGGGTSIKIIKLEEGTNTPLSGAVFEVVSPDGDSVGTFSTKADGTITVPVSQTGSFSVTELTAPAFHLLPEVRTQHVTVVHGRTAEVTFVDAPFGNLRIEKYSNTGEPLSGVTFQVKHLGTGETLSGQTGPGGALEFSQLKPGGVEVRETAGIEGWQADTETVKTATIVAGETSVITFINKELPGLRIVKYDLTTHQPLPNVTFEVYKDGTFIGRYTTGAMGDILLLNVEPGTYLAKEVSGDDAHVVDSTPQEIELKAGDGIRELVFFNSLRPGIHLVKVDSVTMQPLPNVRFAVKQKDGNYQWEYTTDERGEIDLSKLTPGAYEIFELAAPEGYLMDDAVRYIEIKPDDTAYLVFTNTPKPKLRIVKTSSDGSPLAGVQFRIARIEDGTHYLDRTTDEHGEIIIDGTIETLLEPGVYSIRETATTSDHILDLREFHVELFPGKTSTLVIENQRRPNLTVFKHDADTGEPIADTVFEVRGADGHSVDEIRTGPDGKATLDNLLPGVYQVSEKSVPADWLMDADPQLITLYPNRDHTVYFRNHRKPSLTVTKISSVTGKPLEGAKFQVTYGSNNTVTGEINDLGIFYTNESGQFTLTRLRDGWYRVEELASVPGFQPPDGNAVQTIYIGGGDNAVLTFENVPLSAITVYKFDSVTGEAVSGAVFEIRYLTDTSGTGGTAIGRYKTGANGSFTVTGLIRGTYIVEELASDGNHVIDSAPQTVFLSGEDQDVVQVYFGNTPKGSVLIVKKDALTGAPLAGVEFTVTDSAGALLGNANGIFTTDASGSILIDNLAPGTTVIAKESRGISGYVLDDTPQTVQVKPGATVTLEFLNQPKGGLIVEKYDSVTKQPLSGAVFRITDANGELLADNEGLTSSNGLYTSNAEGQIVLSKITPSTLLVTEVTAPEGYRLDPKPQTVVVGAGDTQTLRFYDDPLCTLTLFKRDAKTLRGLGGATFYVRYSDGRSIGPNNGRYVSEADGTVTITGIMPDSTVLVSEERAPTGYIKDESVKSIIVRSGEANSLTFDNEPTTTLIIRKYVDGTNYEPVPHVGFRVIDGSGAGVGPDGGVYYTDNAGEIVLTGLEPGTTVTAYEFKTVDGMLLDGTPQSIIIKGGEVQHLTFFNQKLGTLVIKKLSSADRKTPLEGVEFQLTYADGGYVDNANGHLSSNGVYFTDSNGEIRINGIVGTVVCTEEKSIDGYSLGSDRTQTVVVRADETQTLYFYNDPWQVVTIQKYISGTTTPLAGVTFLLTDGSGAPIGGGSGEFVTDANGRITISAAVGTTIIAREIRTVKGFILDTTPQTIVVKAGGSTVTSTSTAEVGAAGSGNQMTFYDEATGSLTIIKRDSVTGKVLKGARFLITYANGEYVAGNGGETSSNGIYTSDNLGQVVIKYLQPSTVVIREVEAPSGYVLDDTPVTVEIAANDAQTIEMFNTPIGGLELIKVDAADKTKRIPNTKFEIRRMDGGLVETVTTDRTGRVHVNLDANDYYAVEVEAAQGYKLDETPTYFTVADGKTTTVTVTNKAISGILIHKTDSVTGKGIYGVTFLLYDSTNTPIGQYTSDNQGYVYIENLTASGRYYLREMENEGYIPDTELKTVYVTAGQTTLVEWKNVPITAQIQITKKSADYNSTNGLPAGTLLEGAVFEIRDKAGNLVDTIQSDNRGVATSKPLPLNRYTIREVKAPANYGINENELTAYLEHEGQIVRFEVTDKSLTTGVSITKTGPKEAMAGQPVRYQFSGIANTSNTRLDSFYFRDTLPAEVRLETVVTGTWNFPGTYKITYRVNGGEPRTLADNLSTSRNYKLEASPVALGLASNERVTEIMFVFGQAPGGFAQVEAPNLYCTAVSNITTAAFVNVADVGGVYDGVWIQAVSRWVTNVYGKPAKLPRTGY